MLRLMEVASFFISFGIRFDGYGDVFEEGGLISHGLSSVSFLCPSLHSTSGCITNTREGSVKEEEEEAVA